METRVIILDGKFSEDTALKINEFLVYMQSIEEINVKLVIGAPIPKPH